MRRIIELFISRVNFFYAKLISNLKQYSNKNVEYLRIVRRASPKSGSPNALSGKPELTSIYSSFKNRKFYIQKDELFIERIKWFGTTKIIKKMEYNDENLETMLNEYDKLLSKYFVHIEEANVNDFETIQDFIRKNRKDRNKYYITKKKEYLIEYINAERFKNYIENENIIILKLIKEELIVGYVLSIVETIFDDDTEFYDKRIVIKDILVDDKYALFNFEYYIVERIKRIAHHKQIHKINIELTTEDWYLLKKLKRMGFEDMQFIGEIDKNTIFI